MHITDPGGRGAFKPWGHPACQPEADLLRQCVVRAGRSGGPGGQNRNKLETFISIEHTPSGLHGEAGERRTQMENRRVALRRLRLKLAVEVRCPVALPHGMAAIDGPWTSDLWRSRLVRGRGGALVDGARLACNPEHEDYPALVAEAMDVLADSGWEASAAGLRLGVTASQVVKLLRDCPPAMRAWNEQRRGLGLHPMK